MEKNGSLSPMQTVSPSPFTRTEVGRVQTTSFTSSTSIPYNPFNKLPPTTQNQFSTQQRNFVSPLHLPTPHTLSSQQAEQFKKSRQVQSFSPSPLHRQIQNQQNKNIIISQHKQNSLPQSIKDDTKVSPKEIFESYLTIEYENYNKYVLLLILDTFLTSFFMLWSLSSGSLPKELLATKFFHITAPLLCINYWVLYNYPIHFYNTWLNNLSNKNQGKLRDNDSLEKAITPQKDILPLDGIISLQKIKDRIATGVWLRAFFYLLLLLVDGIYFAARLIPLAIQCFSSQEAGEALPTVCAGWEGSTDNKTLFIVTLVIALIQIIIDIAILIASFVTQSRIINEKPKLQ